jgi:hypothetical protein
MTKNSDEMEFESYEKWSREYFGHGMPPSQSYYESTMSAFHAGIAHVKKAKIQTNDYVETIDGDDFNPAANNLTYGSRYRKPAKKKKVTQTGEAYSCWMNGNDEVFV